MSGVTIDQAHDAPANWRLVERRRLPRKRVSETLAGWGEPQKSWRGKQTRDSVTIEDLSENGARLVGRRHDGVEVGSTIEIELADKAGQVIVRYIASDPLHADKTVYGVELADMDHELRQAILGRLDQEQTGLEWVWENVSQVDEIVERQQRLNRAPVIRPRTVQPRSVGQSPKGDS